MPIRPAILSCCALILIPNLTLAGGAEVVQFAAGELTIHADFFAPSGTSDPAPVVVLLHRQQGDRASCANLAAELSKGGLAVLALDLRGHGDSSGPENKNLAERAAGGDKRLFKAMHRDVAGAMAWLAGRDDVDLARIALVGVEAGGAVALNYAARDRSVDAVALLAPSTENWGLDSGKDLGRYGQRPVLLLGGSDEQVVAGDLLAASAAQATVRSCQTDEGTPIEAAAACGREIVQFVGPALGDASDEVVYASINSDVYHPADSRSAGKIKTKNRRAYSSPAEAEARGLRATRQSPSQEGTDKG